MVKLECFSCGNVWIVECADCVKEVECPKCGAFNVVPEVPENLGDDWLQCLEPQGFEWSMPAGKLGNPITGYTYVTASGQKLTKEEYIAKFKLDPDAALEYMRKQGKIGTEGYTNLSTLGDKKQKPPVMKLGKY